jgi:hypothetical protein
MSFSIRRESLDCCTSELQVNPHFKAIDQKEAITRHSRDNTNHGFAHMVSTNTETYDRSIGMRIVQIFPKRILHISCLTDQAQCSVRRGLLSLL